VIFDLSFDHEISFLTSMVILEDYFYLDMIIHIFLNEIVFIFVLMFAPRRIVLAISIPAHLPNNGDSSYRLQETSTRTFGCFSLKITYVGVLLSMLVDYFTVCIVQVD
jgi:hypothetical protein